MREIVSIHVGQAGVQTGAAAWDLFCLEHGIGFDGYVNAKESEVEPGVTTFFDESCSGRYVPRAIMVDLEPSVIDCVSSGASRKLFHPDWLITGSEDAASNFARGHYTVGKEILERTLQVVRKVTEQCNCIQGFFFYHSVGGGTGSGLNALLSEHISHLYPNVPKFHFTTWPSPQISTSVVEPYNSILSLNNLLEYSDIDMVLDNEAIYDICQNRLKFERPSYSNLNSLVSQVISSFTTSLRFNGDLNIDMNEFQTNLVPYPRLHFMLNSYSPIMSSYNAKHEIINVNDITAGAFQQENMLCKCDPTKGLYMACCLMYRGDVAMNDVNKALTNLRLRTDIRFVPWSPTGFKTGISARIPVNIEGSGLASMSKTISMISNNTNIVSVFSRIAHNFDLMFSRRAFVHWFIGEGMEESEFVESRENVTRLEEDYLDVQDAKPDDFCMFT